MSCVADMLRFTHSVINDEPAVPDEDGKPILSRPEANLESPVGDEK